MSKETVDQMIKRAKKEIGSKRWDELGREQHFGTYVYNVLLGAGVDDDEASDLALEVADVADRYLVQKENCEEVDD